MRLFFFIIIFPKRRDQVMFKASLTFKLGSLNFFKCSIRIPNFNLNFTIVYLGTRFSIVSNKFYFLNIENVSNFN